MVSLLTCTIVLNNKKSLVMVGYGIAYMQVSKTFRNAPDAQGVIMVNYGLMTAYTGPWSSVKMLETFTFFFQNSRFLRIKCIITDRLPMFIIDLALALTFIKRICFM